MKAILLEKAGGAENLHLKEIDRPVIKDTEVLVNVKAISLNPADVICKTSDEMLDKMYGPERPLVLGWDIAGTIESVGKDVHQFKKGDKVFGMVNFPGVGKAYAEYVASPANHLAKIPEGISFESAAATTLAALTALQILEGNIKKGDRVLIQGGSGGVGHFGVQIAKAMGAYVITTAATKNEAFVHSLGVDEYIDYRKQNFEEILTDIDFVLNIFRGDVLEKTLPIVKKGGKIVSTTGPGSEEVNALAKKAGISISPMLVNSNEKDINTLSKMLENKQIVPHIYKTFPFANMSNAHVEVEKGSIVGKVIVIV